MTVSAVTGQAGARARTAPRIATMRAAHLDRVVALEQSVHDRPWSPALFASELAAEGRRYLTAWAGEEDDDLLGYGGVMRALDEAHITTVAVAPTARRRGIATRLVLALLDAAVALGTTAATLEVRASNTAAQRLYARVGFAPVGVRRGYYGGEEDAIIMWVHDIAGPRETARRAHIAGVAGDRERGGDT
ncbi:ribosomal protein S18-alanine N-acetyltransferase [Euzebya sp.]|uniref:ribosomal protein S18-alanine N-acetyltransferase n=1 Tax=Euzebya sp. TaxID=1971409 RepID=UPI0035137DEF